MVSECFNLLSSNLNADIDDMARKKKRKRQTWEQRVEASTAAWKSQRSVIMDVLSQGEIIWSKCESCHERIAHIKCDQCCYGTL